MTISVDYTQALNLQQHNQQLKLVNYAMRDPDIFESDGTSALADSPDEIHHYDVLVYHVRPEKARQDPVIELEDLDKEQADLWTQRIKTMLNLTAEYEGG